MNQQCHRFLSQTVEEDDSCQCSSIWKRHSLGLDFFMKLVDAESRKIMRSISYLDVHYSWVINCRSLLENLIPAGAKPKFGHDIGLLKAVCTCSNTCPLTVLSTFFVENDKSSLVILAFRYILELIFSICSTSLDVINIGPSKLFPWVEIWIWHMVAPTCP